MIKCVLFDLDGTILNTIVDLTNAVNYALQKHNYNTRNVDEVLSFIGDGVFKLLERALPSSTPKKIIEDCLKDFRAYYDIHMKDNTIPYDGTMELMKKLKNDGYKLGVVSNKYYPATNKLCQIFNEFMDIYIGEGPGIPKKPDPTGVKVAMKFLKVNPEETIFVGDSKNDYEVSINAKTSVILVSWGYTKLDNLMKYNVPIAKSNEELYELIKNS